MSFPSIQNEKPKLSFPEPPSPRLAGVAAGGNHGRFSTGRTLNTQTTLFGAISACALLVILVAGLWPFHAPRNEVSWSSTGNGVLFGKHGSIVSANPIPAIAARTDKSCGLEIWLEPRQLSSEGTVLAFYSPASGIVSFTLRQWRNGLVLERERHGRSAWGGTIYVGDVFRGPEPVLFTISSGEAGTAVYVDGTLVRMAPDFKLISQDLSGEFVIGNRPLTAFNWSGQVKGLAIYDRELTAAEVSRNYANWTSGWTALSSTHDQSDTAKNDETVARYLFNEAAGNVIHNQVDPATSLLIPERFFILHQKFLERPWDEFKPSWDYWQDVGINIAGFIPLGFFFQAYVSATRRSRRTIWITIALGFAVSLTIEVLQAFLPTRDSGMTDLITNTFGTALGAIAWVWIAKHSFFERASET
jgi:VanZ like family/Concanavalin A-like lectin/glucanases superfamily